MQHARAGSNSGSVIRAAVIKHGPSSFEGLPLFYSLVGTECLPEIEASLIVSWAGRSHGYNVQAADGAVGPYGPAFSEACRLGKAGPEPRAKLSASTKAWLATEEGKAQNVKTVASMHAPEIRTKANAKMRETVRTPEMRAAASARAKVFMNQPGFQSARNAKRSITLALPHIKARMSASHVKQMEDPEMRARVSAGNKKTKSDPEWKIKQSAIMTAVNARPEKRERASKATTIAMQNPELRARIAAAHIGRIHITNGIITRSVYPSEPIPSGWWRGLTRKKKESID